MNELGFIHQLLRVGSLKSIQKGGRVHRMNMGVNRIQLIGWQLDGYGRSTDIDWVKAGSSQALETADL